MKVIDQNILLSVEDFTGAGVSEKTLHKGFFRDSPRWQSVEDPADRRKRLVKYDTLADKYKELLRVNLWNGLEPAEWLAIQSAAGANQDADAVAKALREACENGYTKWLYVYAPVVKNTINERLRVRQHKCLARAAAVMECLGRYYTDNDLSWRDSSPIGPAVKWLKDEQGRYFPLKYVPMNPVILKTKIREIFVEGRDIETVITLPRAGNDFHAKHKEDADVRAWCIQARMSGRNLAVNEIARRVRRACELTGKPVPSTSWIKSLLAQPAIARMCADSRWGKDSNRGAFYKGYVPTTRALYAGDCWQMDGTRVNILPHYSDTDKKARFLVVVAVRDVYSGDILGVSFGVSENRWMYLDAMKMAVKSTGYLPYELVHDKFPGHNTEEMEVTWEVLKKMGVKRTVSAVATGKAQAERWFGTLQSVFLTREKYYYGEGIRSTRPYAHRSPELLAKLRKEASQEGFDFDAAWQMAWSAISAYRHTPIKLYSKRDIDDTPSELHTNCEKAHAKTLEIWEQATVFWNQTTLQIRRNAVTLTVRKREYIYPVRELAVLNYFKELTIRYDESDLSTVLAFDPKSDVLACELKLQDAVQIFGPDADWGKVQAIKTENKAYTESQREALRAELEGSRDLDEVLGEDTLLLGARVPKGQLEEAETNILFEQMGLVSAALKQPVNEEKPIKKARIEEHNEPFNARDFVIGQR